jgi:hypothetical protein
MSQSFPASYLNDYRSVFQPGQPQSDGAASHALALVLVLVLLLLLALAHIMTMTMNKSMTMNDYE